MYPRARLWEQAQLVLGFAAAVPATGSGLATRGVCLRGYDRAAAILSVHNATSVTGSAISLEQATAVDFSTKKALGFDLAARVLDFSASGLPEEFAVASDTFTTPTTDNAELLYMVDITPNMLDVAGGYDCARLIMANAAAATCSLHYLLWPAKQMPPVIDATLD